MKVGLLTAEEVTLSTTDAAELDASPAADETDEAASSMSSCARTKAAPSARRAGVTRMLAVSRWKKKNKDQCIVQEQVVEREKERVMCCLSMRLDLRSGWKLCERGINLASQSLGQSCFVSLCPQRDLRVHCTSSLHGNFDRLRDDILLSSRYRRDTHDHRYALPFSS